MSSPQIAIRPGRIEDETAVMKFIERTGFFRPVEMDIAREVFTDAAYNKPGCTYQSYVAEIGGKLVGWICFGATPCTLGTFDMYWIAVDPDRQGEGIGRQLSSFAEQQILKQNGRLIVVETSGMPRYESTRKFYEKTGYILAAEVPDFYAAGDPKCIYLKSLTE
jgi:ribosomal protein S18 acetylase RimI-like enzyme